MSPVEPEPKIDKGYSEPRAEPADRYSVTVNTGRGRPKRTRDGVTGDVVISWVCEKRFADQVRDSLQVHSPSIQRGRPQLWINAECVTPAKVTSAQTTDLAFLEEDDEARLLAEHLDSARENLTFVRDEVRRLAQERDNLLASVERTRREAAEQIKRSNDSVAQVEEHNRSLVERAQKSAEKTIQKYTDSEIAAADRHARLLESLGGQADANTKIRERLDRFLRRDIAEESIQLARDLGKFAIESPAGDALAFWMAGLVAERKAQKAGEDISTRDVQAAMMREGKAFRKRIATLKTWVGQGQREHVIVGVATEYLLGVLPLEALEYAMEHGHRP